MNGKSTILIAAIIMAAAFAGVFAMSDSDAADELGEPTTYTLTYHLGDKSVAVENEVATFNVLGIDDNRLAELDVPTGKEFKGWNTAADGSGVSYIEDSTLTIQGVGVTSMDLYAVLEDLPAETVSVKFDVNGTVYTQTLTVNTNGQVTLPTIESLGANVPAGQEFRGWTAAGVTYAPGSVITAPAADTTYEAAFSAITYTVTFDIDGTKTTVSGTAADTIVFPADPSKAGMTFRGWSDGTGIVEDTTGLKFSANVTYTAVFVEDFALTFEVNGTVYDGGTAADPIIPQNPTREGYNFAGWSIDGKTVIQNLDAAILAADEPTRFVAVFEPVDCIVTFTSDGQTVLVQTVKYGEKATEPALVPEKDGYDFKGWDFDFDTAITADTEIVAVFEETPEPEPTGLKDPMTLTLVAILVIIIGALLVVAYLKWDVIKGKMADRLTKGKGGNENE